MSSSFQEIMDAINIVVKKSLANISRIDFCVVKSHVSGDMYIVTVAGTDHSVKCYGGTPNINRQYPLFVPFGNMSQAFIIIGGSGGGGYTPLDAYPIGSVYISYNATNPATLFGGTWERKKDVFFLAAGDTFAPNTSGGEATHTLTTEEMPSHIHQVHAFPYAGSDTNYYQISPTPGANVDSVTRWTGGVATPTGGGQAHNNMPPYETVYAWKRTA